MAAPSLAVVTSSFVPWERLASARTDAQRGHAWSQILEVCISLKNAEGGLGLVNSALVPLFADRQIWYVDEDPDHRPTGDLLRVPLRLPGEGIVAPVLVGELEDLLVMDMCGSSCALHVEELSEGAKRWKQWLRTAGVGSLHLWLYLGVDMFLLHDLY